MTLQTAHDSSERYRRSLLNAQMSDLLGLIRGKNRDLASYEEVARRVKAYQQIEMGTQMIPLNQIVGSVGRYKDFTREFLPRTAINKDRWTRVDKVLHSMEGYPPIDVYKIGEVYFVRDGNHRVSVARANGLTHIEAYVTEVLTNVPLTMDDFARDQWLVKTEQTEFLARTKLDELRPNHGVQITEPGRHRILLRHIFVHQYLRNMDLANEGSDYRLSWEEAVGSWYDTVYTPVIEAIRTYGILAQFPGRTEADVYLWVTHHREEIASHYDLGAISPEAAVSTFAQMYDDRILQRAYKGMKNILWRAMGSPDMPPGMSEEEFAEARSRYEAGERTLKEAEEEQAATVQEAPEGEAGPGADDSTPPYELTEPTTDQQRPSFYLSAQ